MFVRSHYHQIKSGYYWVITNLPQNDFSFFNELNIPLNFFSPMYENVVLLGDFNFDF